MTTFSKPNISTTLATLCAAEAAVAEQIDQAARQVEMIVDGGGPIDLALERLRQSVQQAEDRIDESLRSVQQWMLDLATAFGAAGEEIQAAFVSDSPASAADPVRQEDREPSEQPPVATPRFQLGDESASGVIVFEDDPGLAPPHLSSQSANGVLGVLAAGAGRPTHEPGELDTIEEPPAPPPVTRPKRQRKKGR